jgi:hypothetical protein
MVQLLPDQLVTVTDAPQQVQFGAAGLTGAADVHIPDPQAPPPGAVLPELRMRAALHNAGFATGPRIVISPATSATGDAVVRLARPGPGRSAVLLVCDETGAVTWHWPTSRRQAAAQGAAASAGPSDAGRVEAVASAPRPDGSVAGTGSADLEFAIPARRFSVPVSPAGAAAEAARSRAVLLAAGTSGVAPAAAGPSPTSGTPGAALQTVITVLEHAATDPAGTAAEDIMRSWEASHPGYAVRTVIDSGIGFTLGAQLSDNDWAGLAQGPSLLFIHGIFSSCLDAFGSLPQETMSTLIRAYEGRVFAFDHPTASAPVESNVAWFLDAIPPDTAPLTVDVVCHSRGGLVARLLADPDLVPPPDTQPSPPPQRTVIVNKVIFAGTPNVGTPIVAPGTYNSLINRITSMLNGFPPGPWSTVTGVIDGILQLVRIVAIAGAQGLPGLECMTPGSPLLTALNTSTGPTPTYYAIDTDFTPPDYFKHPFDLALAAEDAADKVLDLKVFDRHANDVAVPTDGVGTVPGAAGFPVPVDRHLAFGPSTVWHCSYYSKPQTWQALTTWLDPQGPK